MSSVCRLSLLAGRQLMASRRQLLTKNASAAAAAVVPHRNASDDFHKTSHLGYMPGQQRPGFHVDATFFPGDSQTQNHHHLYFYRQVPENFEPWYFRYTAVLLGTMMGFWALWNTWHDPGHVFGELDSNMIATWTDEQLGIPADDEDD